jgi:Scramblase
MTIADSSQVPQYLPAKIWIHSENNPLLLDNGEIMIPLKATAARSLRLPALRVAGVRYRNASRLNQPRSSKRPSNRQASPSSSSRRIEKPEPSPAQAQGAPSNTPSISDALASTSASENNLLAPVHIPEDPNAVLKETHPATALLANSGLVVQRQIEMMNIFLGFEQANRYVIMDPHGHHVGYMAEQDGGFGKVMGRQWLRTHRAFTTHVFNREQKEVLRVRLPIWPLLESRIDAI